VAFPADSFNIGPIQVHPPLVLAPMHEVTDEPYRRMILQTGAVGLTVSEMISCEALIRRTPKARQMMASAGANPFAVQLSGYIPEHLADAARMARDAGAHIIDLNMGCPASSVTKGGGGSALLRDLRLAEACVKALVGATDLPVTVKMRAGWDGTPGERESYLEFLRMFDAVGVKALAIHPRTRAQKYEGAADWSLIARAVDAGTSYPIIGNGDVRSAADALRLAAETGCHGVMIGRAALTNPWIFRQILDPCLEVGEGQRMDLCLEFCRTLQGLFDPSVALYRMKRLGTWFTLDLPGGVQVRRQLYACTDPDALYQVLEDLRALRLRPLLSEHQSMGSVDL